MNFYARTLLAATAALVLTHAVAAGKRAGPGTTIYTCTDAQGRTITTDRPIADCHGGVQRQLSSSGATVRIIEPEQTPAEREAAQERQRVKLQEQRRERARVRELAQRDRALLIRYPDRAAHEHARRRALESVDDAIAAANKHLATLARERRNLDSEFEFYESAPERIPGELQRSAARNREATDMTLRLIASQEAERERIAARYDAEVEHLEALWRVQAGVDDGEASE